MTKLYGVPEGASETLLLRCLRQTGAKAVYIPKRRGGGTKQSAVVTFEKQEDLEKAVEKPVKYNNWTLNWPKEKEKAAQEKIIPKTETNKSAASKGKEAENVENPTSKEIKAEKRGLTYKNRGKYEQKS